MCTGGLEKSFIATKSFACAYFLVHLELILSQGGAEELFNFTRVKTYRNTLFVFNHWSEMPVIKVEVKDLHKSDAAEPSAAHGAGTASSQLPPGDTTNKKHLLKALNKTPLVRM